jgi:TIGR03943 family protein
MKSFPQRRFNPEILLRALLLLGFSACFITACVTGSIRNYLNPRLFPFVLFAGLAFLFMAVSLLLSLFSRRERKLNMVPYLLFLVPMVLVFALPAKAVTADSTQLAGLQIAGLPAKTNPNLVENDWGNADISGGTVTVTDKNYMACYEELWDNPEKYKGKKIECIGYITKTQKGLRKNQFIVSRDMMWCCAADLAQAGYLCSYGELKSLPEKGWIKVKGTLAVTVYQGKSAPLIVKPVITQMPKPAVEYIYPFQ